MSDEWSEMKIHVPKSKIELRNKFASFTPTDSDRADDKNEFPDNKKVMADEAKGWLAQDYVTLF